MKGVAVWLSEQLNDALMAFVALLSVGSTVAPFVFELTDGLGRLLYLSDVLVLLIFVLEYGANLLLAERKGRYARSVWRLLDAFIILGTLLSLLPLPTDFLGAAPALRLIRFARLAVLGTRSSMRLAASPLQTSAIEALPAGSLEAFALDTSEEPAHRFQSADWGQILERIGSADEDWLYVSGITEAQLAAIAGRLRVPERVLRGKLFETAFPRIDRLENYVTLFVWYPELERVPDSEEYTIRRTGLLLVGSERNVAVLARGKCELPAPLERWLQEADGDVPALVNATHALMREVIRAYVRVAEFLETRLVWIDSVSGTLRDREFLEHTFRLRSDLSLLRTNLRHLTGVTRDLSSHRIAIRGFEVAELPQFQLLASSAADVFERVDDLRENLAALVEMRLNVTSFQMNKVMRVLAILTTLALIPSVAGGMLGMNLIDNPWAISLPQVVFWVGMGMALSVYLFAIKGWLR